MGFGAVVVAGALDVLGAGLTTFEVVAAVAPSKVQVSRFRYGVEELQLLFAGPRMSTQLDIWQTIKLCLNRDEVY